MKVGDNGVRALARLSLVAIFSLVACGDDSNGNDPDMPFMPGPGAGGNPPMQPPTIPPPGGPSGVACAGTTCPPGQVCFENTCRMPCASAEQCPGQDCCGGICTAVESNRQHCGACDRVCESTESCTGGACTPAMCSGTPGAPVMPPGDEDAGAPEDGAVFAPNGCPPNELCTVGQSGPTCQCGSGPGCPRDQLCSTGGMCRCGDGPGCLASEACCGDACIDVMGDQDNCGACGNVCPAGTSCAGGMCRCPNTTDTACESGCANLQTDIANCGTCGTTCAEGASCVSGECRCDVAGQIACHGSCVEADTNDNCGRCDNACIAGQTTCREPTGLPLDCYCANVNHRVCDGVCRATQTDANHCGGCNVQCAVGATCSNGQCACNQAGFIPCDGVCIDGTTTENCAACGLACRAGEACDSGECTCTGAGEDARFKWCDTASAYQCIPVVDDFHCGSCGNACIGNSACIGQGAGNAAAEYECVCQGADTGKTHCREAGCTDLQISTTHCGSCGNACEAGEQCCNGSCKSAADYQEDEANCGACGAQCGVGERCCGGTCVNPQTNRSHCGSCGNACANTGCRLLGLLECRCQSGVCET
jgi:hypothetical protein